VGQGARAAIGRVLGRARGRITDAVWLQLTAMWHQFGMYVYLGVATLAVYYIWCVNCPADVVAVGALCLCFEARGLDGGAVRLHRRRRRRPLDHQPLPAVPLRQGGCQAPASQLMDAHDHSRCCAAGAG
jgi:hypothetical protein